MVMRADVLAAAIDAALPEGDPRPRLLMSPRGRPLDQAFVTELAGGPGVLIVAGRFEGVDERVIEGRGLTEVSVGDYVLSGGEIAAMALIDAVVRLLPGVMGNAVIGGGGELRRRAPGISALHAAAGLGRADDPRGADLGRSRPHRRVASGRGGAADRCAPAGPQGSRQARLIRIRGRG